MSSHFLSKAIRDCGMSERPEYYSGRGATTSDLDDRKLEAIWTSIRDARGDAAAEAFVTMVEKIGVLSATNFLLTLYRLSSCDFAWNDRLCPKGIGIHAECEGSAWGTVMSLMSGMPNRDETHYIRSGFLKRHGREPAPAD